MSRLLTYGVMQQKRKIVGTGFKTEWTVSGDATARTITLPLINSGTFNCTVKWGDGTSDSVITAYNDADRIHTYASDGTYEVEITGNCPSWSFNNGGDKLKITKIVYWGDIPIFSGFSNWQSAFYGCTKITSIGSFTSWVTSIASMAFYNCTSLVGTITIPDGCTAIGDNAFRSTKITGINLGSGVISIGSSAFFNISTLTSPLVLPYSLKTINAAAFVNCPLTGDINIPSTISSLANDCFVGNNFSSATSDNSSYPAYDNIIYDVKTSGEIKAIINARGYSGSLSFRNDTTRILTDGFPKRTGTINIPSQVTHIGDIAFINSVDLTGSLNIPSGVIYLGVASFQGCTKITGVTLSSGIKAILASTFYNCTSLVGTITIPDGCTAIGDNAFRSTKITGINLGSGVISIGSLAFFSVSTLAGTLTIPATIKTIGSSAFVNCPGITLCNSYPSTAPTVAANGLAFGGTARALHIPSGGGTGYDVEPWTTATIFTQPAIDDL